MKKRVHRLDPAKPDPPSPVSVPCMLFRRSRTTPFQPRKVGRKTKKADGEVDQAKKAKLANAGVKIFQGA